MRHQEAEMFPSPKLRHSVILACSALLAGRSLAPLPSALLAWLMPGAVLLVGSGAIIFSYELSYLAPKMPGYCQNVIVVLLVSAVARV